MSIWEFFKDVKLVTKPAINYNDREVWAQGNTVHMGRKWSVPVKPSMPRNQ